MYCKYEDIRLTFPELFGRYHLNKDEREWVEKSFNGCPGGFVSIWKRISVGHPIEVYRDQKKQLKGIK